MSFAIDLAYVGLAPSPVSAQGPNHRHPARPPPLRNQGTRLRADVVSRIWGGGAAADHPDDAYEGAARFKVLDRAWASRTTQAL